MKVLKPDDVLKITDFQGTIFIDTNILIFLLCPIGDYQIKKNAIYSRFISNIKNRAKFVISNTILSEFINTSTRLSYNQYIKTNELKYKDYRKTVDYQDLLLILKSNLDKILKISTCIEEKVDQAVALKIVDDFYKDKDCDYNDLVIENICVNENVYILTDDGDFKNRDLNIISANNNYF